MSGRLAWGFNRKREEAAPAEPPPSPPPVQEPPGAATPQARAALELSQELLRGMEYFILSTPDLDIPGFMERLRRTAARLTPGVASEEVEVHRIWAAESLPAFGQLQRRYLSEREDELWRLLALYQEQQKGEGAANKQFHEQLRGVHERMGRLARLDDLRQVRERMEAEVQRATSLLEEKARMDRERSDSLAVKVRQLEAALGQARDEATRDPLTGVFHRGAFESRLETTLASTDGCALAMMDVDNFKEINDTLGHLVGDQILRTAVQLLGRVSRPGDVIGRYGGDEFCLLAPATPADRLAERFNRVVAQQTLRFEFEQRLCAVRLSFSVGVAGAGPGDTARSLIQRADEALLEAKRRGKGQARLADAPRHPRPTVPAAS